MGLFSRLRRWLMLDDQPTLWRDEDTYRLAAEVDRRVDVEAELRRLQRRLRAQAVSDLYSSDHMARYADLDPGLRHRLLERAKEILLILQVVEKHRLLGDQDAAFDTVAQRLAFLLFGEE